MSKYICILLFLSFCCCQGNNKTEMIGSLSISHIKTIEFIDDTYETDYEIKNFVETDSCFRFLFDFAKELNIKSRNYIVTNAKAIRFDERYDYDKTEVFIFQRFNSGFRFVSLRPEIRLKEVFFEKEILPTTITFKGDFDELNIDVLENFIREAYREELDKEKLTHLYELYNKNNIKKVVIDYHEKGEWFEIEIL